MKIRTPQGYEADALQGFVGASSFVLWSEKPEILDGGSRSSASIKPKPALHPRNCARYVHSSPLFVVLGVPLSTASSTFTSAPPLVLTVLIAASVSLLRRRGRVQLHRAVTRLVRQRPLLRHVRPAEGALGAQVEDEQAEHDQQQAGEVHRERRAGELGVLRRLQAACEARREERRERISIASIGSRSSRTTGPNFSVINFQRKNHLQERLLGESSQAARCRWAG